MDFYKVLNVSRSATTSDIKKSFKKLALTYHPDMTKNDVAKTEQYKKIAKAYEVLIDSIARSKYDSEIGHRNYKPQHNSNYSTSSSTQPSQTYRASVNYATDRFKSKDKSRTYQTPRHDSDSDIPLKGINEAEWNAWHYGDNAIVVDAVKRSSWMDMNEDTNRHYRYYSRRNARQRAKIYEENMKEAPNVSQAKEEELRKAVSDSMQRRRQERRSSAQSSSSEQWDLGCCIQ